MLFVLSQFLYFHISYLFQVKEIGVIGVYHGHQIKKKLVLFGKELRSLSRKEVIPKGILIFGEF